MTPRPGSKQAIFAPALEVAFFGLAFIIRARQTAKGGGVINTIISQLTGIGSNLVESDAQFVHGNSGSPIIDVKNGKVIGVATYLTYNWDNIRINLSQPKPGRGAKSLFRGSPRTFTCRACGP